MAANKNTSDGAKKGPPVMMIAAICGVLVVVVVALVIVQKVSAKQKPPTPVVEKGPILELDEFLVNLADGDGHFLKVTVDVELKKSSGKTAETMKEDVPRVRDAVLTSLTGLYRESIMQTPERDALKDKIKDGINKELGEDLITHVYFTNFVTQ